MAGFGSKFAWFEMSDLFIINVIFGDTILLKLIHIVALSSLVFFRLLGNKLSCKSCFHICGRWGPTAKFLRFIARIPPTIEIWQITFSALEFRLTAAFVTNSAAWAKSMHFQVQCLLGMERLRVFKACHAFVTAENLDNSALLTKPFLEPSRRSALLAHIK